MNWKSIFTIAKKDIYEARQNKSVWMGVIIVPLIFVVVLPLVFIILASSPSLSGSLTDDPDTAKMLEMMPAFMTQATAGMNLVQSFIVTFLGYFFTPFFLILPVMCSSIVASESFAGEKERKTIEALLYTPATDTELFLGKVLAAFIPALIITWVSFLGYIIVLNVGGYPLMGRIWFPLTNWYPLIFWVSPAISLLAIAATVLISSKVTTFMGAYQTSASLVVLVLALIAGQATGVLYLSTGISLLLGVGIWLVDVVLSWLAIRTFSRERLLASVA